VRYHVSSGLEKRGVVRMNGGGAAARQRRACIRTLRQKRSQDLGTKKVGTFVEDES
jgi:hypothetical protein